MLTRVLWGALLASLLVLSGCGDKSSVEPAGDEATAQQGEAAGGDAVDSEVATVESDEVAEQEAAEAAEQEAQKAEALAERMPKVYFDFDRSNIRQDMQSVIDEIAQVMKEEEGFNFRIEGNCDEWGTEEYNYALGLRRAKSIQDALLAKGVDADRLSLISYGESNPVCTESNRDCWQQNRRGEFTTLP